MKLQPVFHCSSLTTLVVGAYGAVVGPGLSTWCMVAGSRMNRGRPMGGFIQAETLVLNGTAGGNGTGGGTLLQPILGFQVG